MPPRLNLLGKTTKGINIQEEKNLKHERIAYTQIKNDDAI